MQRHHSTNKFFGNKISFNYIHDSCNLVRHRNENGDVSSMQIRTLEWRGYTVRKENQIFLIYKEIQIGVDHLQRHIRGVLGNKCAGQHNLKTLHFKETIVSAYFQPWSSAICIFFCSTPSTTGQWRRALLQRQWRRPPKRYS